MNPGMKKGFFNILAISEQFSLPSKLSSRLITFSMLLFSVLKIYTKN